MSIPHVISAVFDRPWFITPGTLDVIGSLVLQRDAGVTLSREDIAERLEVAAASAGARGGARVSGAVGVLPIYGALFHRANLMTDFSGGTTYQGITRAFREAMADESIGGIVLEFDSPGGEVGGLDELASEVRAARAAGNKPIVAHANTLMASAAYYLAAQANEIVASSFSLVGSIGTVMIHQETSKMDEAEGITTTIIRKPEAKYRGNSLEPLDDETKARMQAIADEAYGQFVNAVAKGRGVSPAAVRAGYGQGDVLHSRDALAAGLIDRVESLDDTIRRVGTGKVKAAVGTRADAWDAEFAAAAEPVPVEALTDGERAFFSELLDLMVEDASTSLQLDLDRLRAKSHTR